MSDQCEVCGSDLSDKNHKTTPCPACERMRCESCDCGAGTVCSDCEDEDG